MLPIRLPFLSALLHINILHYTTFVDTFVPSSIAIARIYEIKSSSTPVNVDAKPKNPIDGPKISCSLHKA